MVVSLFLGAEVQSQTPVLCYHGFSEDTVALSGTLVESYARFEEMLDFLKSQRVETIFPEEADEVGNSGNRRVIITFDDGRKDQLRAAETMSRYGFRGLFFIIPARLKEEGNRWMNENDLLQLHRWGHRIGVHGFDHRSLPSVPDELDASIVVSRQILQEVVPTHPPITSFAFPFGHYDSASLVKTAGAYSFLYTVNPGYWDGNSQLIPRMLITSDKPIEFFQRYVLEAGNYRPLLRVITPDGAQASVVEFVVDSPQALEGLHVLAVSADRDGYHYALHPAEVKTSNPKGRLSFSLRDHIKRFFSDSRRVLSYAFVRRGDNGYEFVTNGVLHWIAGD
jgi:peptidoglycan/xylan/chitin deacetylase (PgdA/CDA1 family)